MTYPQVKFVDAPSVSATVRLDLNDSTATAARRVEADFDLGVPTLEGDPDAVGQTFGFRSPSFTVQIKGTKANALAFISALSKEMLRQSNWLMFKLNATTQAVWFKTYRTGYQPLSLEQVYGNTSTGGSAAIPDTWRVTVPLVADAFAYGARVTIPTITFGSSLSATNPMQALLPALKGDAPTGLRIKVTPTTGAPSAIQIMAIASDATITSPVIDIGLSDGLSAQPGTAGGTANTAYLGGSYRAVTIGAVTPPTSNQLLRLTGTLTAPPAARYRVLLHCQADAVNSTTPNRYVFAFGQVRGVDLVYGPSALLDTPDYDAALGSTSPFEGWVDLGEFTFPPATFVPPDLSLTQPNAAWGLTVGTPTGLAGTVRLDAIKLVPIDSRDIRSAQSLKTDPSPLSGSAPGNWDGDDEMFWGTLASTGALFGSYPAITHSGTFPTADPAAAANLLVIIPDGTMSENTGAWTADVSYCPRYLHIGDGT